MNNVEQQKQLYYWASAPDFSNNKDNSNNKNNIYLCIRIPFSNNMNNIEQQEQLYRSCPTLRR